MCHPRTNAWELGNCLSHFTKPCTRAHKRILVVWQKPCLEGYYFFSQAKLISYPSTMVQWHCYLYSWLDMAVPWNPDNGTVKPKHFTAYHIAGLQAVICLQYWPLSKNLQNPENLGWTGTCSMQHPEVPAVINLMFFFYLFWLSWPILSRLYIKSLEASPLSLHAASSWCMFLINFL